MAVAAFLITLAMGSTTLATPTPSGGSSSITSTPNTGYGDGDQNPFNYVIDANTGEKNLLLHLL